MATHGIEAVGPMQRVFKDHLRRVQLVIRKRRLWPQLAEHALEELNRAGQWSVRSHRGHQAIHTSKYGHTQEYVLRMKKKPLSRRRPPASRLSAEDWADAGLHVIARRGWAGLTIDNVAEWLRVTKGSFYWHFDDRRSFLKAVLSRWRFMSSSATLAQVAHLPDPRTRLRRLL